MRSTFRIGMALLLWAGIIASPGVSAAGRNGSDATAGGLLSADQGEMLVDFALQSGAHLHSKPDCSHLVHMLYSRAGLNYPYQPSRALYLGVEDFERVRKPQAGDLIVWRGHVGIVVSPEEKTFFSSVRSGIITESWTADHWLARGHPRFYRYRLGPDSNPALLASLNRDDAREARTGSVIQEADENDSDDAREDRSKDSSQPESSSQSASDAAGATEKSSSSPDDQDASSSIVAVMHQRKKPDKQEIAAAFSEANNSAARRLSDSNSTALSFTGDHPLSVFTHVEVTRIKMKHNAGSVTLKLAETIVLEQGRVTPAKTTERELTIYRSDARGTSRWILSDPRERIYIPQSQALAVFQHQAELLLHSSPNSPAARTAVKALDLLYDQQPGNSQRASLK